MQKHAVWQDEIAMEQIAEQQALLVDNLRKYRTLAELRKSPFYAHYREQLESLLTTPEISFSRDARPRVDAFLRIAQWNIEKGKRSDMVLQRLLGHEILQWADIIVLNEADRGMIRSQNRHVAKWLAQELNMHMVFAPAHIELTKGTGEELGLEGENIESLQGNAILSRYPVLEAVVITLPQVFEPYEFPEKRFGGRNCVWARIQLKQFSLWVGSVHLELRSTPGCRARQMHHIMDHLPGSGAGAYILGGDFNTNTFARGTAWRAGRSLLRLLTCSPSKLKEALLRPERGGEPLFAVLNRYGFAWEGFNSNEETARVSIDSLEEAHLIPELPSRWIKRKLTAYEGVLSFKLDWLVGKNIKPLRYGEKIDTRTGTVSLTASCVHDNDSSSIQASDHQPIFADIALE